MFILYYKPPCPFCQRVLEVADSLGVEFDLRDISDEEEFAAELVEKGGKRQVPFLVDTENNVSMYESDDIITYIKTHQPAAKDGAAAKPRVHVSSAVCESCEG